MRKFIGIDSLKGHGLFHLYFLMAACTVLCSRTVCAASGHHSHVRAKLWAVYLLCEQTHACSHAPARGDNRRAQRSLLLNTWLWVPCPSAPHVCSQAHRPLSHLANPERCQVWEGGTGAALCSGPQQSTMQS